MLMKVIFSRLLINKLLSECEKLSGKSASSRRRLVDEANFKVTVPKVNDLLQFEVTADKFITSTRPIEQLKAKSNDVLPDLYPMKCTISLPKKNIYTTETFYRKILHETLVLSLLIHSLSQLSVKAWIALILTRLFHFLIRNLWETYMILLFRRHSSIVVHY